MQDFWLLNGFFLALGLIHIIISLVFLSSSKSRNPRHRSEFTTKPFKSSNSKKVTGYNLLVTGLIISAIALLSLWLGQSVNLLVLAAINLATTFTALRLHLFHVVENVANQSIHSPEKAELIEEESQNFPQKSNLNQDIRSEKLSSNEMEPLESALNLSVNPEVQNQAQALPRKHYVEVSPEIFAELSEISDNPSASVDEAIRWWLRRRLVDNESSASRTSLRSSASWRSQQQNWND
ncbi:MAG: hypothetical protein DCE90_16055 [Pseudanabaena sp.]|nr:MAG: hypothetical protein DCE90_16055 [Pseudanabaena sp.]